MTTPLSHSLLRTLCTDAALVAFSTAALSAHRCAQQPPPPPDPCGFPSNSLPPFEGTPPPIPADKALVWRDENGVAHVEANDERSAWRALGYERAREGLLQVQAGVKAWQGRAAEVFGVKDPSKLDGPVMEDVVVKLYGTWLAESLGHNPPPNSSVPCNPNAEQWLRLLLRRTTTTDVALRDKVFDNLKAFAEGLDQYRARIAAGSSANPPLDAQETKYRAWLVQRGFHWAFQDPITVFDIASAGGHNVCTDHFAVAARKDPSYKFTSPAGFLTTSEANQHPPYLDLPAGPQGGSNSYAWSNFDVNEYIDEPYRSGLVTDPHLGSDGAYGVFRDEGLEPSDGELFSASGAMIAHVVVHQAVEPIDMFGPLGANGFFGGGFNGRVAIGGSQGSQNPGDAFLLRLNPDNLEQYYDYYYEGWRDLEPLSVTIKVQDTDDSSANPVSVTFLFKRAGKFGIIVNTQPFYAEDTHDWRVGVGRNVFRDSPLGNIDMPVLVAYRIAADPKINVTPSTTTPTGCDYRRLQNTSERHLYRAAVSSYERIHAQDVEDIRALHVSHDRNGGANTLAMDTEGRMFATTTGTVPRRGDDAAIETLGIDVIGKHDVYDVPDTEPVPARWPEDKAFDWVFSQLGKVRYLEQREDGSAEAYYPFMLFDPAPSTSGCTGSCFDEACVNHPPTKLPTSGSDLGFENIGIVTMSNNPVWEAWKKLSSIVANDSQNPCPAPPPDGVAPDTFHTLYSPDNKLLDFVLKTGTSYASRAPAALEFEEKNKNIVDTLRARGAGSPLDLAGAISFAQDNRNYVDFDYAGYEHADGSAGGPPHSSLPGHYPNFPVAVRNLFELDHEKQAVLDEAAREVAFFRDLWNALRVQWFNVAYHPPGTVVSPFATSINLCEAFTGFTADGSADPLFWFPELDDPSFAGLPGEPTRMQQIPMPAKAALIDFLYTESRVASQRIASNGHVLDPNELLAFEALVADLTDWGDSFTYRNDPTSAEAALLLEYDLGFNAEVVGNCVDPQLADIRFRAGRFWTPLEACRYLVGSSRFDCATSFTSFAVDLSTGLIPGNPDPESKFTQVGFPGDAYLLRYYQKYEGLAKLIFSDSGQSVMHDNDCAGVTVPPCGQCKGGAQQIFSIPRPPYAALYVDPDAAPLDLQVKSVHQLTPCDINALVVFFLRDLGKFTLEAQFSSPGVPSPTGVSTTNKVALVNKWLDDRNQHVADEPPEHVDLPYPAHYPLTRSLVRVSLMRRLLETKEFLDAKFPAGAVLGDIVRAKAHDFDGVQQWPPMDSSGNGAPSGTGAIGAVALFVQNDDDVLKMQGFQERVWAGGGSHQTMLTLFPRPPAAGQPPGQPETYFLAYPGTRANVFDSPHAANMMCNKVQRLLAPTHMTDFKSARRSPDVVAFPVNPYVSPP